MTEIKLFLPGAPPTHTQQERKIAWNQHRTYLDPKAKQDRQKIINGITDYINSPSDVSTKYPNGTVKKLPVKAALGLPWNEPCTLHVCFYFGTKQKQLWGKPKATKPDIDNLLKSLLDSLQMTGVITNDSRIVSVKAEKVWVGAGDEEGISIVLEKVPEEASERKRKRR